MVSIIIPSYNNAKYLERCLKSIFIQKVPDYEVVVVDDGSTDNTSEICAAFLKDHKNLNVIRKVNEGVSTARNTGLAVAKGDYIVFVDSDDYITGDALTIINKDLSEDKDLYIYNNFIIRENGITECPNSSEYRTMDELILETFEPLIKDKDEWLRTIWSKVYKREILNKVHFPKEVHIGQDACFFVDVLYYLKDLNRIKFIDKAWYVYDRTNEFSATHKYKRDMYVLSKLQFDYLMKTVDKFPESRTKKTALCKFCFKIYMILYFQGQLVSGNNNCFRWYEDMKRYINEKDIDYIEFESNVMNKAFRYRGILSVDILRNLFEKYYAYQNTRRHNG